MNFLGWKYYSVDGVNVGISSPDGTQSVLLSDTKVVEWLAAGNTPQPAELPTQAEIFAQAAVAAQSILDAVARSWGYDDMKSAVTYVGDPCAKFNAEATALRNWRSEFWQAVAASQAAITSGKSPMPTSVKAFTATLPAAPERP